MDVNLFIDSTDFELSNDAVFIVDKTTGYYLDANKEAEMLTGRSLAELRKLKTSDLTPLNAEKRLKLLNSTTESTKLGEVEYHRPDGTTRIALLSTIPLNNNSAYGIAQDITLRKKLDLELKNSIALTEATFESIHNGLLVVNNQGAVIKTNAKFTGMWQIPDDILASGDDHKLLESVIDQISDLESFIAKVSELYENPEAESFDLINLKDGRIFERISKPMYLGGKPMGRVWSFLDITERFIAEKKLLDNKAHLQTLIQTIPDMIWLKDPSGVYLSCNMMFERLVGAKETDIVGKTDYDLFSHENAEFFRENDLNAIEAGKPQSNEEWLTFADDSHHALLDVIKTPMFDSKGTLIGVLGIGHDITERKRIEEALKDSEDKFSKAFLLSPYAITIASGNDGKFIEMNDAFVLLSGYSRAEALGRTAIDLDLWVNVEDRNGVLSALIEGKDVTGKEFEFKKRNGVTGTGLYSAQIIHLNNEPYILSSINDITYRKEAEKAIRESEEQFRSVLETVSLLGLMLDIEGRITLCNDYLLALTGWTPEEVMYRNWFELFLPPEIRADIQTGIFHKSIMDGEIEVHYENEIITREGERRLIAWNNMILHDQHGKISGVASIGEDITERKRSESEIKLKNEQLIQAHAEKDKFFSIIAHDLRSPFSSFLGLTQIMAEDLPSRTMAQVQDFAISMSKSASNLYGLLENLLKWSQMQQGSISFKPEVLSLISVVDECIAISSEPAKNKNIQLLSDIRDDIKVFADNNALQTIIRNLVSNAMKFTPADRRISISAKTGADHNVEISISDTGIGMSAELVDNLFRLDVQTSRKGINGEPSSGLGLMLCKEFIEKNGGKIWVESEVGKGSVFYFSVPSQNRSYLIES